MTEAVLQHPYKTELPHGEGWPQGIELIHVNDLFAWHQRNQQSGDQAALAESQAVVDRITYLLGEFHKGYYQQAFPDPSEQQSLAHWMRAVQHHDPHQPSEHIYLAGFGLSNPHDPSPRIAVFRSTAYFPEADVGLLQFVVKDPYYGRPYRNGDNQAVGPFVDAERVISHTLEDLWNIAVRSGNDLSHVFCECNNPDKVQGPDGKDPRKPKDVMDPDKRLKLMAEKYGRVPLNLDYVPENVAEAGICEVLLLLACPNDTETRTFTVDPRVIKDFLLEYFRHYEGADSLTLASPQGQRMMGQVEAMIRGEREVLRPGHVVSASVEVLSPQKGLNRSDL